MSLNKNRLFIYYELTVGGNVISSLSDLEFTVLGDFLTHFIKDEMARQLTFVLSADHTVLERTDLKKLYDEMGKPRFALPQH